MLLAAVLALSAAAQSPQPLSEALEALVAKIEDANPTSRPMRLAVLQLRDTGSESDQDQFGSYMRERLTAAIGTGSNHFRLFERSRLDQLLSEHSLHLSGVIHPDEARKLGELAPIDAILSGSYTRFEQHVEVNARVTDVVTGEILGSASSHIYLDKDLRSLFKGTSAAEQRPLGDTPEQVCVRKHSEIKEMMNDLSTPQQISAVVDRAIRIPYDEDCGVIHYSVMGVFKRYGIDHPLYQRFLLQELSKIDFPANDERANSILTYFGKDSVIDEEEWQTGLEALRKVGNYRLSGFVNRLLLPRELPADLSVHQQRIDKYFELAASGKIGLPVPITFNSAFLEMIEGLNSNYAKDNRLLLYCFERYRNQLDLDADTGSRLHGTLTGIYKREVTMDRKEQVLRWIAEVNNHRPVDEDMGEDLFSFARGFEITQYKQYHPEELAKTPPEHLSLLVELCRERFCEGLRIARYRSQVEEREEFCIMHAIPCQGFATTLEACLKRLDAAPDSYERERTLELMTKMGVRAAGAEKRMTTLLQTEENQRMKRYAIEILGNIRTERREALELLIENLNGLGHMVAQTAEDALVNVGAPAVPYLIQALESRFGGVQYKAASALGRIGPPATAALPHLRSLNERSNSAAIHSITGTAIRQIEDSR